MNYKEVRLGDVCKIGRGSSPRPIKDERYFINGEIPWVKIADATASGKYIYNTKEYVNEFGASFSRLLSSGSLIFPASGTLGIPRFLGVDACIHDGWLYFDSFNGIDSEYLYYLLITLKDYYISIAYGAAIQNINTDMLRDTIINLPDLNEQKRIAEYLCNYDNLIENNRKRIALLEESARLLYQEWFVKFRFPDCKIGDEGFPDGWTMCSLSDLVTLHYGKSLKESAREDGDIPVFGSSGIVGKHNKFLVKGPSIIVGRKGNVGSVYYTAEDCFAIDTVYFIKNEEVTFYNFFLLQSQDFVSSDTAVPGLNRNYAYSLKVLKPAQTLLKKFEDTVAPMFEQIQILSISIDKLQKARDELLPKLVSGKIKV